MANVGKLSNDLPGHFGVLINGQLAGIDVGVRGGYPEYVRGVLFVADNKVDKGEYLPDGFSSQFTRAKVLVPAPEFFAEVQVTRDAELILLGFLDSQKSCLSCLLGDSRCYSAYVKPAGVGEDIFPGVTIGRCQGN